MIHHSLFQFLGAILLVIILYYGIKFCFRKLCLINLANYRIINSIFSYHAYK